MNVTTQASPASSRLVSLDVLRGFDMIWIMALDTLVHSLGKVNNSIIVRFLNGQLEHAQWAGFTFYDLIFPLFVFIMGAAMVFSLTKIIERNGRRVAVKRILIRGAILFVLGLLYYGGVTYEWPHIRLLGVLQRLGLVYIVTGLLFCYLRPRALVVSCFAILIGYCALLTFIPIRNVQLDIKPLETRLGPIGDPPKDRAARWEWQAKLLPQARELYYATPERVRDRFEPGLNVANHFDFEHLPGSFLFWDPEGLLSTIPAIASSLLGVFAGFWLRHPNFSWKQKVVWLFIAGVLAIALGWLWGLQFPVIKKIWTSSYVLVAAGWSFILLALFYYLVDVRQWRRWCALFLWIGMNPITLYLAFNFVDFYGAARRLVGGNVGAFVNRTLAPGYSDVLTAAVAFILVVLLARFLYQRKIFLRL